MSEKIAAVNQENFGAVVLDSKRPVLVDFWADWCGPCRALAPIVERLAERYAGKTRFVKLNVDENPAVVERYRIQAIPTLILFHRGEEKERIIGVPRQEEIARAIEVHAGVDGRAETEAL